MTLLKLETFLARFDELVSKYQITWEAVGFYSPDNKVYPFGTDTKVISTVFEALAGPLIKEIADEFGYIVEGSQQTVYPDFTLTPSNRKPPRIAIDIKTTYRRFHSKGEVAPFRYTLGSYTSFLRSPGAAKNIRYPYEEYNDHWVIGFLYTRRLGVAAKVYYRPEEISELLCPYLEVEYFVQEKHKIVGYSPASGNTTNIGSFPTNNIEDLRQGHGPFATHGKKVCDSYWRQFAAKAANRAYSNIEEFLAWEKRIETAGGEN
jgi:hypothetical protein